MTDHRDRHGPGLGEWDPSKPNTVTFTADSPEHARIMTDALMRTLLIDHEARLAAMAERRAEHEANLTDILNRLESPEGYQGMRLWLDHPQAQRRRGVQVGDHWYDEPVARTLFQLIACIPGHDSYGLPEPRPRTLFFDWAHRRLPVREHGPCARPAEDRDHLGVLGSIRQAAEWSRRQYRNNWTRDPQCRWGEVVDSLPDAWQLRAGLRIRMPDRVSVRAEMLHEQATRRGWSYANHWEDLYGGPPPDDDMDDDTRRRLYEGRFTPPSGPQDAAEQDAERRRQTRERRRPWLTINDLSR